MIDWQTPEWSYLLGVIHGDGHIAPRSIEISVGYQDEDYAETLVEMWMSLGYSPKMYRQRSGLRIDIHNKVLRDRMAQYKQDGIWAWPEMLNVSAYLSGVFDADGYSSLSRGPSGPNKVVGITLKRSGNLNRLAIYLADIGIVGITVKEGETTYNGRPYLIESIRIGDSATISKLGDVLCLRNSRKAAMLKNVCDYARAYLNRVPRWRAIGRWLEAEGPKDYQQVAKKFNLSKAQVDSALQHLRRHADLETIPPPIVLTKYRIKEWRDT